MEELDSELWTGQSGERVQNQLTSRGLQDEKPALVLEEAEKPAQKQSSEEEKPEVALASVPEEAEKLVSKQQSRVSFALEEESEAEQEEPDEEPGSSGTSGAGAEGDFSMRRRRAQSCFEPARDDLGRAAAAGNPAEELAACLEDLSQAEECFGANDARVARCLRRMALTLAYQGRSAQAVPLWIRVLEIERPLLGSQHPDVLALEGVVKKELSLPGISPEAAAAYSAQLADAGLKDDSQMSEEKGSRNLAAAAASLGSNSVALVGGAVVSGALHLGLSAMSSTCSLLTNATGSLVSYAATRTTAAIVRATPAEPVADIAATAVGYASDSAIGAARASAGAAFGAVSQVGVSLASSATSSAISYAGQQAWHLFSDESKSQGIEDQT